MRSQQLGPISCWSQTAHPGRGPAGWSGSPLPSAHTEPPQGQVLLSPQSGHHCAGVHKHRGVKVEGAIVGEMPETNTPETHAHGGLVGEEAAPETGQPSRPCTMVPLTCSLPSPPPPRAPPAIRPLSPASGSRLHSSVPMLGGPPSHHRPHRSIVRASASPSGSCRRASLQTCRWVTHSQGAPRESHSREGE